MTNEINKTEAPRIYVVFGRGCWGKGPTLQAALETCPGAPINRAVRLPVGATAATVDEILGRLHWEGPSGDTERISDEDLIAEIRRQAWRATDALRRSLLSLRDLGAKDELTRVAAEMGSWVETGIFGA